MARRLHTASFLKALGTQVWYDLSMVAPSTYTTLKNKA